MIAPACLVQFVLLDWSPQRAGHPSRGCCGANMVAIPGSTSSCLLIRALSVPETVPPLYAEQTGRLATICFVMFDERNQNREIYCDGSLRVLWTRSTLRTSVRSRGRYRASYHRASLLPSNHHVSMTRARPLVRYSKSARASFGRPNLSQYRKRSSSGIFSGI